MASTEYVVCPFDKNHIIRRIRIQYHLVKCKESHPENTKIPCPFDATEYFEPENMADHLKICKKKLLLLDTNDYIAQSSVSQICGDFTPAPFFSPEMDSNLTGEVWDDDDENIEKETLTTATMALGQLVPGVGRGGFDFKDRKLVPGTNNIPKALEDFESKCRLSEDEVKLRMGRGQTYYSGSLMSAFNKSLHRNDSLPEASCKNYSGRKEVAAANDSDYDSDEVEVVETVMPTFTHGNYEDFVKRTGLGRGYIPKFLHVPNIPIRKERDVDDWCEATASESEADSAEPSFGFRRGSFSFDKGAGCIVSPEPELKPNWKGRGVRIHRS